MAHALYHLRKKVVNTPQLMSLSDFENVIEYLDKSDGREIKKPEPRMEEDADHNSRYTFYEDDAAAIFTIEGPMTYKPVSFFGMDCGGFSYTQFKKDFGYVVDRGAKTVALMINSGGGEAHQLFPTMRSIRKLADANGVKIVAYVDGVAFSAAYGTAAIADEIILSEGSEVGSIGVVVRLMNDSKHLEQEGYERIFITAGKEKVPFKADGKFKESFLQDIQNKVDVMYEEFVRHVATFRNISEESVKSTEARTYLDKEAIELGLADKTMGVDEFYLYLSQLAESRVEGKEMKLPKNPFSMKTDKDEETLQMEELQKLQAALDAKDAEMSTLATQISELTAQMESLQAALGEKEAALSEALAKAKAAEEQAALQAKEAKLKDRQAALFAAGLSEEDAKSQAASLEALDDATFETVRAAFAKQYAAVQGSDLFQQQSAAATEAAVEKTKTAAEAAVEATRKAMKDRGI